MPSRSACTTGYDPTPDPGQFGLLDSNQFAGAGYPVCGLSSVIFQVHVASFGVPISQLTFRETRGLGRREGCRPKIPLTGCFPTPSRRSPAQSACISSSCTFNPRPLPARNRRDFDDIPLGARNKLEFVWLERVDDAVAEALDQKSAPSAVAAQ